ncbi:FG-GAP repeat domain-containing protein [Streptomyces sp. NPDC058052]|uniref:FG-GAP repeat domain-containing protein n=1 Tax=Streptomyces sp. NPDC058052 TaxID=3346316 RepID=UPI0036E4BDEF
MLPSRPHRRRLAAAVSIALAATTGVGLLTAPAHAAPPAAVAVNTAEAAVAYPQGNEHDLVAAGLTGYLTRNQNNGDYAWRRFDGAPGETFGDFTQLRSTRTDDYLVVAGHSSVTQRNLTTGASLQIPVSMRIGDAVYAGSAADAVFTALRSDEGSVLRSHTAAGTATVSGFPDGATEMSVTGADPDHALVTFQVGTTDKWGLIDLATGTVGEIHDRTRASSGGDVAASATHVAWTEGGTTANPKVFVLDRATDEVREIPVPDAPSDALKVGLLAGWVVFGEADGIAYGEPNPLYPLVAYSLTDPAAAPVTLLDHLTSAAAGPEGSLYVRGGLVGKGEGLYRIEDKGGAEPETALVAATGEPTEIVIGPGGPPAVVDLDKNGGKVSFAWDFSRTTVDIKVTLRHVRTGRTSQMFETHPYVTTVPFTWDGTAGSHYEGAPNGAYTWTVEAKPLNGIGPTATATGGFTVTRATRPHDFNDNAGLDLLSRDTSGRLWRQDSHYSPYANDGQIIDVDAPVSVGNGWQIYDRIEATGNLAGSAVGDLVARDRDGVLWLYQGNGTGGFATRVRVGGGWQIYDKISGGSDLTGDGRADVLATDRTGVLWLYPSTGKATSPFATRKRIGAGWGGYTKLVATGNIGGAAAGDVVARDKDGVLWQYLGKGDGTLAQRTRVGGGWNTYTHIVAVGDSTGDGRADLVGLSPDGNWLYKGTGSWSAPFKGRELMGQTRPVNAAQLVF